MSEIKTVTVEKPIPVTYDLGNLAVFDTNPVEVDLNDLNADGQAREEALQAVTRDNAQLLINQLLSQPIKNTTDSNSSSGNQNSTMSLIMLPQPSTRLPREKPIPKPKALTKWQEFALKKGIKSKARDGKLVYDEATGKWVPKWGFNGKNKELDQQWCVEVDDGKGSKKNQEDVMLDPRALDRASRKKLVKKNQKQQERNIKRGVSK